MPSPPGWTSWRAAWKPSWSATAATGREGEEQRDQPGRGGAGRGRAALGGVVGEDLRGRAVGDAGAIGVRVVAVVGDGGSVGVLVVVVAVAILVDPVVPDLGRGGV